MKEATAALSGADTLVIVTEWKTYQSPNLDRLKAAIRTPVIFDGRNLYKSSLMKDAGIACHIIGRNST